MALSAVLGRQEQDCGGAIPRPETPAGERCRRMERPETPAGERRRRMERPETPAGERRRSPAGF